MGADNALQPSRFWDVRDGPDIPVDGRGSPTLVVEFIASLSNLPNVATHPNKR